MIEGDYQRVNSATNWVYLPPPGGRQHCKVSKWSKGEEEKEVIVGKYREREMGGLTVLRSCRLKETELLL